MFRGLKYGILFLAAAAFVAGCQDKTIIPEDQPQPGEKVYTGCIPENPDKLVQMYIDLPNDRTPDDIRKEDWLHNATIRIDATVNGATSTVYKQEGVKIKGHGNTTWTSYPKKPYTLKLPVQANLMASAIVS